MTDYLEAILTLWSAPSTIGIVLGMWVAQFAIAAWARPGKMPDEPGRPGALVLIPLLSVFLWIFLGASLAMCLAQAAAGDYSLAHILRITGVGLVAATALTVVLGILVWSVTPRRVLAKVAARAPTAEEQAVIDRAWAAGPRKPTPRVLMVDGPGNYCFAVGGPHAAVVVSRTLFFSLDDAERAGILAHESGHLQNGDALVKTLSGALSRVLLFDPALRLLDPLIHRSREYAADSASARAGLAADLASALVRIAGAAPQVGGPKGAGLGSGIVGPDRGWRARYPPLGDRVERLLKAAVEGPPES